MDTRLEMEREPAQQSSRSATIGNGALPAASSPTARTTTPANVAKAPLNAGGLEHQSLNPLRATDLYRLVMPYSLRL